MNARIELADLAATQDLAAGLAALARTGDVILLRGDLGVGKTSLARAFIHAFGVAEEVPSPTFSLVQIYETARGEIWHVDLYRIDRPDELGELGMEEALGHAIMLVEWPDRLGAELPGDRLDITLEFTGQAGEERTAVLDAHGDWAHRLDAMFVPLDRNAR